MAATPLNLSSNHPNCHYHIYVTAQQLPGHALILGSSTVQCLVDHVTWVCPPTSNIVSKPKTSLSHDLNTWVLTVT